MADDEREPEMNPNSLLGWVLDQTEPHACNQLHPDDATVLAIATGDCEDIIREQFLAHAGQCSSCRKRLSHRIKELNR